MKSPHQLTLHHLKKQGLINDKISPIVISGTTLDFTYQHKVNHNIKQKMLISLANHQTYFGTVVNAKAKDDQCIFIFSDGTYYQGECKDGKFEGKGQLVKYGQDFKEVLFSYQGQWHQSKPHGRGEEKILHSMNYVGEFQLGKKNGKGVMTYIDGSVFQGEFKNNQVQGQGTYKTKAHEWSGTWKEGYLEGQGQQISIGYTQEDDEEEDNIYNSGGKDSVYQGGFSRGLKHGQGTYKWGKNISEYSGTFQNGQLDGEGRFTLGGSEYKGFWKKGVQLSLQSTIQFKRVKKGKTQSSS